ncbi:hypothetical protein C3L33_15301, partial [Rhododendron williamsianum]
MQTLLKSSSRRREYSKLLRRCVQLYGEAEVTLGQAFNDMNSEDYYDLGSYAADSARNARDCQAAFRGRASDSRLSRMNRDFLGLPRSVSSSPIFVILLPEQCKEENLSNKC